MATRYLLIPHRRPVLHYNPHSLGRPAEAKNPLSLHAANLRFPKQPGANGATHVQAAAGRAPPPCAAASPLAQLVHLLLSCSLAADTAATTTAPAAAVLQLFTS